MHSELVLLVFPGRPVASNEYVEGQLCVLGLLGNGLIMWLGFFTVRAPVAAVVVLGTGEQDQGALLGISELLPDVFEFLERDSYVLHIRKL